MATTSMATRDGIVKAAQRLIAARGAHGCTVRDVAAEANVTPGAIYRHFDHKDALVDHVLDLALERFQAHLIDSILSLPVGSFARVAALGEAYLEFARDHEQEFRVLFLPAEGSRKRLGQLGYPILRRCVAEAIESGQIRDDDPDRIALYLWSRVQGIATLFMACDFSEVEASGVPMEPVAFFEGTRDLLVGGLLPPEAKGTNPFDPEARGA